MKIRTTLLSFVVLLTCVPGAFAQKLKAEEIIAKHLDSIATPENRKQLKNLTATGDVQFAVGPAGTYPTSGKAVLSSEGSKTLFAMTFPLHAYPLEKIVLNNNDVNVSFADQGRRSGFGGFIFNNKGILKEGVLGGVLSTNWTLIDTATRGARIANDGTKKIDGRDVYIIAYEPKKADGLRIKLYFDKENFRHVRTEYSRVIGVQMGLTPESSARQSESFEDLTEEFFDFKTEYGVTLPRGYRITLSLRRDRSLGEYRYTFTLKDFYYNQQLDANTFAIGK